MCTINNGNCEHNCEDEESDVLCFCEEYFVLQENGQNCSASCATNPCQNGGTCSTDSNADEHFCECATGFTGERCETAICEDNLCQNGGSCSVEDNGHICSCTENFKGKYCQIKVARLPLPYGPNAGHETIESMNAQDDCYRVTDLPCPIKVGDIYRNSFYICENGIVTFNGKYRGNAIPVSESERNYFFSRVVVAPYFSDIVLSEDARIYYQIYTEEDISADTSVNDPITSILEDAGYSAMEKFMLLVVTWENVLEYGLTAEFTSTFQLIIISDGMSNTEAFYAYLDGGMMFATSENLIGFVTSNVRYYDTGVTDPVSKYTNLGRSGFVWRSLNTGLDTSVSQCKSCRQWVKQQTDSLDELQSNWNRMPLCPCIHNTLRVTGQFNILKKRFSPSKSSTCYNVEPDRRRRNQGSSCCYSRVDNSYISVLPNVGFMTKYNPFRRKKRDFYLDELEKREMCCDVSDELCDLFHTVRPRNSDCSLRSDVAVGGGTGDPHILTPDGKEFTFNGHGEYTLMLLKATINETNVDFTLQGRTAAYKNDVDEDVGATVFSAFAAVDRADGSIFQIEMNSDSTSLLVSVNKQLMSSENMNEEDFVETFDTITLSKPNNDTLDAFFSNSGIKISVGLKFKFLTVSVTVPNQYKGLPRGLFGNVDGDPDNDFISPDGVFLTKNLTDREIFSYGQNWNVSGEESVFEYPKGATYRNYQDFNASVHFLDEASPEDKANAETFCGIGNIPCIFDRVFTGRDDIATSTKEEAEKQNDTREILANEAPTVVLADSTGDQIRVNLTQVHTVTIRGHDDGEITYKLLSGNDVNITSGESDELRNIVFKIKDESDSPISITVTDNKNVSAPTLVLDVIVCTGCSGNGVCDYSRTRLSSNDAFDIALCICDVYYEGDYCEADFNGCEGNPCSRDRNCTDNPVEVHISTGKAFTCSDCPEGFVINSEDVCIDINECNVTHQCSDVCMNTVGSYRCTCSTGRRAINGTACEDINECEEGTHNCSQKCTNTNGGFNCSCYPGYEYDNGTCNQTSVIDANDLCKSLNCNMVLGGCYIDNGSPTCFCNNGYRVNGSDCSDINECELKTCSQNCDNTVGSFKCRCYAGYQINADQVSCDECPDDKWGENCAEDCVCSSQGSGKCDNVKGCICNAGWTGTDCSENVDECTNLSICEDVNKYCSDTVGSYQCICRDGYQKNSSNDICIDINECSDPDLDNCEQECVNTAGSFTCACDPGYNIDQNNRSSCVDVDECILGISGCQQDCQNIVGSYNCLCYFGYTLNDDLKTCKKMSGANTCSSIGLNCTGFCITNETTAHCACGPGYTLAANDQMTCIDVNECNDVAMNKCQRQDTCINTDGGYKCSCVIGESLQNDRRNCTECDPYHYGDNCVLECNCGVGSETCNPVSGCQCKSGWIGEYCNEDINECTNDTLCAGNMVCVNSPGSFVCFCSDGFFNNSVGECENVNECDDAQHNSCTQICTDTVGSYNCSCRDGFQANGTKCVDIDECIETHECTHVCLNTNGAYRCSCDDGFHLSSDDKRTCIQCSNFNYGNQCMNECLCNVENTDTCDNTNGTCYCTSTWTGATCDDDLNECASNTTHNCTGVYEGCHNWPDGKGFECSCFVGYSRVDGTCKEVVTPVTTTPLPASKITVTVTLVLDFNLTSGENLNVATTYSMYQTKLQEELSGIYNPGNKSNIIVTIYSIWSGSLHVNYEVTADKSDSSVIIDKSLDIVSGVAFVSVFGENATCMNLTVNSTTDPCYLKNINKECKVCVFGTTDCSQEENDDLSIVIGLAIGIPLFVILILIIVISFVLCRRKKTTYPERDYSVTGLDWRQHKLMQLSTKGEHIKPVFNTHLAEDMSSISSGSTVLRRGLYLPSRSPHEYYNVMDGERNVYERHWETFDDGNNRPEQPEGMFSIPRPEYNVDANSLFEDHVEEQRHPAQQDSRFDIFTSASNQF